MNDRRNWSRGKPFMWASPRCMGLVLTFMLVLGGCAAKLGTPDTRAGVTIVHLNDVYEITPVSNGKEGGLARVATLRKQLLQRNKNTFVILAGDLLSPSALGSAPIKNGTERFDGRQIVAVMNTLGLDYATFGNHEFDLKEESFLERLRESRFRWFSSNVRDADGRPFPGVAGTVVITASDDSVSPMRVGLIGVTIDSNRKGYVSYADPVETVKARAMELRNQVDVLVAVTHLSIEQDARLAAEVPGLDLILGGHEHDNFQIRRGPNFVPIFRADANARSVYIHDLLYDREAGTVRIASRFEAIDDRVMEDPETDREVIYWRDLGYAGFRRDGFEPEKVIAKIREPLDGLESSVRNQPARLGELIAQGMLSAAPGSEAALFNSGSIRIDDVIPPGNVTVYDVIRIMPFGGKILSVEMRGSVLRRVLDQGRANRGTGGYLQTANVRFGPTGWLIDGKALVEDLTYRIALNDFLLSGREQGMEFLISEGSKPRVTGDYGDIRKAFIAHLQAVFEKEE